MVVHDSEQISSLTLAKHNTNREWHCGMSTETVGAAAPRDADASKSYS